jgi:hypothetical protein
MLINAFSDFMQNVRDASVSPVSNIPAYLASLLMQDIIAEIRSGFNIIDEQTAWGSCCSTPQVRIFTDHNNITVSGDNGKVYIHSYLFTTINLGHGIPLEDIIDICPLVMEDGKIFLRMQFVASIDTHITLHRDYLIVMQEGTAVVIHGHKYLGQGMCDEK